MLLILGLLFALAFLCVPFVIFINKKSTKPDAAHAGFPNLSWILFVYFLCHLKCIVSLIISFEASLNFIHRTRPVAQVSYKPHEEHTSPPPYSALNFVWYWIVFIFVNLTIIKWYSFNYFELLCASFFNWFWSKHEKFYRFLIFDIFSQRNSQAHKFGYQVLLDLYTMRKFRK